METEVARGLLCLCQGEDIEVFRKTSWERKLLSFAVGPGRAEMTINIPPPEFLCLHGVIRDR